MSDELAQQILAELREVRVLLGGRGEATGLMTYLEVGRALSLPGTPCSIVRQAQRLVRKHKLAKVKLGHRTVKFRPADVEKLKARLAGDKTGGLSL